MKEIKKTLAIFRARWPEVLLLVGLPTVNAALVILNSNIGKTILPLYMALGFISLGLTILTFILNYGFMRTIFLDSTIPHSPAMLLELGRHFFWRMLAFGIFFALVHLLLQWLISLPIAPYICPDTTFIQRVGKCPFLHAFQSSIASLILIKLMLFIPALIFVLDCRLSKSFGLLKRCRLSKAIEPVFLYCLSTIFGMFFWAITVTLRENPSSLYYLLTLLRSIIVTFLHLAIGTMTVRYAASLKLVYVETEKPVGPETKNSKSPSDS